MTLLMTFDLNFDFWTLRGHDHVFAFANSTHQCGERLSKALSLSLCLSDPLKCDAEITTHCLDNACLFALSVGQFACRTSVSDLTPHTHTHTHTHTPQQCQWPVCKWAATEEGVPLSTHFQNRAHFSGFCVRVDRTNRYGPFSIVCIMCPEISFSSCLNKLNELENLICIHKTFCILKQVKKRPSAGLYDVLVV